MQLTTLNPSTSVPTKLKTLFPNLLQNKTLVSWVSVESANVQKHETSEVIVNYSQ